MTARNWLPIDRRGELAADSAARGRCRRAAPRRRSACAAPSGVVAEGHGRRARSRAARRARARSRRAPQAHSRSRASPRSRSAARRRAARALRGRRFPWQQASCAPRAARAGVSSRTGRPRPGGEVSCATTAAASSPRPSASSASTRVSSASSSAGHRAPAPRSRPRERARGIAGSEPAGRGGDQRCRRRRQCVSEEVAHARLGQRAGELVLDAAVDEQLAVRDATDAVGARDLLLFVGVELDERHAAGELGGDLVEDRRERAARRAPRRPEVDEHGRRRRALEHDGLEVGAVDGDRGGHESVRTKGA